MLFISFETHLGSATSCRWAVKPWWAWSSAALVIPQSRQTTMDYPALSIRAPADALNNLTHQIKLNSLKKYLEYTFVHLECAGLHLFCVSFSGCLVIHSTYFNMNRWTNKERDNAERVELCDYQVVSCSHEKKHRRNNPRVSKSYKTITIHYLLHLNIITGQKTTPASGS